MSNEVNILMAGSSIKVRGGMTTVVESFLQHEFPAPFKLTYIATHTEKNKIYNSFFFIKGLIRIIFFLLVKKPKIVHLHMSERGSFVRKYIIYKISKAFGTKIIVHTHGAEFHQYYLKASPKGKKRIVGMLKNVDKVIALGESWERTLKSIESETDTTIIMNSVALPQLVKNKDRRNSFNILFLAVLIKRKGILDLIEASVPVIKEASKNNKRISFQIAGDGELMETAKELIASYGLGEFYQFHGWINEEQKKELLKETDLFVLPSYNEGLPLSILEALSYGIPIISTDVGSVNEAVIDGVNGYLIKPGDVQALSECLLGSLNTSAFEKMGQASRELAERKFNHEIYFKKLEELYFQEVI